MIGLLVTLLIIVLIASVVWYCLSLIPLPPPWLNIVRIIFAIILLLVLIEYLLPLAHTSASFPAINFIVRNPTTTQEPPP